MEKFLQRENAQLSRIFSLKDPNVEVIYVSPFQMTSDVLGYYMKILEIGDINGAQSRLNIIVPDNINKFPPKSFINRLDNEFIKDRINKLNIWFNDVIKHLSVQ